MKIMRPLAKTMMKKQADGHPSLQVGLRGCRHTQRNLKRPNFTFSFVALLKMAKKFLS